MIKFETNFKIKFSVWKGRGMSQHHVMDPLSHQASSLSEPRYHAAVRNVKTRQPRENT